ncbi:hypothetical protein [Streptomyces sp. NPDC001401]|uniref:hypothetical protein n=1 Tax=Streptomyces sp. NPDC001401 TaxID=3364570 RepID=UPI00367F9B01
MSEDRGFRVGDVNNQGNLAMGHGARAEGNVSIGGSRESNELHRRIDELQQLLTQYADRLPDADELRAVTGELRSQLQSPRPNRVLVGSLLTALTAGAGGVNAVLAAVNGIGGLVNRVLS